MTRTYVCGNRPVLKCTPHTEADDLGMSPPRQVSVQWRAFGVTAGQVCHMPQNVLEEGAARKKAPANEFV